MKKRIVSLFLAAALCMSAFASMAVGVKGSNRVPFPRNVGDCVD